MSIGGMNQGLNAAGQFAVRTHTAGLIGGVLGAAFSGIDSTLAGIDPEDGMALQEVAFDMGYILGV